MIRGKRGAKTGGEARRKEGRRRKCLKKREEETWEKKLGGE